MCQHFLMLRSGNQLQLLLQHSLNSWRPILVVHINLYAYRYHCAISLMALCCPFSSTECLWKSQIRPLSLVLLFWIFWWICGSSVLNVLSCSLCCTLLFSILLYGPVFFLFSFLLLMNSMHYRMIVNEWYLPAFATLAVSGASDWVRIAPLKTAKSITILLISSVTLLFEHSWMAF